MNDPNKLNQNSKFINKKKCIIVFKICQQTLNFVAIRNDLAEFVELCMQLLLTYKFQEV